MATIDVEREENKKKNTNLDHPQQSTLSIRLLLQIINLPGSVMMFADDFFMSCGTQQDHKTPPLQRSKGLLPDIQQETPKPH